MKLIKLIEDERRVVLLKVQQAFIDAEGFVDHKWELKLQGGSAVFLNERLPGLVQFGPVTYEDIDGSTPMVVARNTRAFYDHEIGVDVYKVLFPNIFSLMKITTIFKNVNDAVRGVMCYHGVTFDEIAREPTMASLIIESINEDLRPYREIVKEGLGRVDLLKLQQQFIEALPDEWSVSLRGPNGLEFSRRGWESTRMTGVVFPDVNTAAELKVALDRLGIACTSIHQGALINDWFNVTFPTVDAAVWCYFNMRSYTLEEFATSPEEIEGTVADILNSVKPFAR